MNFIRHLRRIFVVRTMTDWLIILGILVLTVVLFFPSDDGYVAHRPCNDPACYMTEDCGGFDDE